MSLRNKSLELAELSIRWRDQSVVLSGDKGLIACGKLDDKEGIQVISSVQLKNNSHYYPVIIEIERSHGWISASLLKGCFDLNINGHSLTKSPLLIKEISFMMPPQTSELFELLISESLPKINSNKKRISYGISQFKDCVCRSEYGILSASGECIELIESYSFGAIKFDITDGECWVFAEDGVLQINGVQCDASQLYVDDVVQWQSSQWKIVGESHLKRVLPIQSAVQTSEAIEFVVKDNDQSNKGFLSFINHSKLHLDHQVSEDELKSFRAKIDSWLKDADAISTVETAKADNRSMSALATPHSATDSQLALLRLGRKTSVWHELQSYSQEASTDVPKVILTPQRAKAPYWHHAVIVSASICGGALLATLVGILFLM